MILIVNLLMQERTIAVDVSLLYNVPEITIASDRIAQVFATNYLSHIKHKILVENTALNYC